MADTKYTPATPAATSDVEVGTNDEVAADAVEVEVVDGFAPARKLLGGLWSKTHAMFPGRRTQAKQHAAHAHAGPPTLVSQVLSGLICGLLWFVFCCTFSRMIFGAPGPKISFL